MYALKLRSALYAAIAVVFCGCAAQHAVVTIPPVTAEIQRDTTRAHELFVDGALHDVRQEYAEGILEYMDALKYDHSAGIMYAIAKDWAALRKPERAAEYADGAIALDSTNTVYRTLRAEIALTMQADFNEAQRQLECIIMIDSDNVQALSDLAGLYQIRGKNAAAVHLYERILEINGFDPDVSLHLAQIYSESGDWRHSLQALRDVLTDDPNNRELRESIAQTFQQLHQLDSAENVYSELLTRFPDDQGAQMLLANLYSEHGRWSKAFEGYKRLLANDSLSRDTTSEILDSLYTHISIDTASLISIEPLIAHSIKHDSANWYARELLGATQLYQAEYEKGLQTIRLAIEKAEDTLSAVLTGGELLLEHQRYNDVLSVTDRQFSTADFRIPLLRSYALEQLKDHNGAMAALHLSLQLNPRDYIALAQLGMEYDAQHFAAQSDSAYEAALALKPDYALAMNNYSYSLTERGERLQQAKKMAQHAVALDSANISYLDTYAWVFYKLGDYDSADIWIRKAVEKGKPPVTVLEHYGDIELKRGNCTEAIRIWNEALRLDNSNESLKQKIFECKRQHGSE